MVLETGYNWITSSSSTLNTQKKIMHHFQDSLMISRKTLFVILLVLLSVTFGLILCTAAWFRFWRTSSPDLSNHVRSALTSDATDVQEQYIEMTPDFTYMLKAKITPAGFSAFASKLMLTPHTASRSYTDDTMWLSWTVHPNEPAWWNPSSDLDHTYVWQHGSTWMFAKHENGLLYFRAWSH